MAYILQKGNKVYKDLFGIAEFLDYETACECNNEILNGEYDIVKATKSDEDVRKEREDLFNLLKSRCNP